MIFEYAVEPSLLSDWNRFQRLVALFGVTKGRLISRYPTGWARKVYDSVPSGNTERTRIEIALQRVVKELLLPRLHRWDDSVDWRSNAVTEHAKDPFQAILAGSDCTGLSFVIDATDLDCTDLPSLLQAGPSSIVTRNATEFGKALRPLLLISKRVVIIEPNFTIKSPRFRDPFAEILLATLNVQMKVRPEAEIELHIGMDKLQEYSNKAASLNAFLAPHIPESMTVTIVAWPRDVLHNRYIVTDRFGISLGEGLGLPDEKTSRPEDVHSVLDEKTTQTLMTQYCDKTKTRWSHQICGTKRLS